MAAGAARVRVNFAVDADGLLNVSASELTSGVEAAITVRPSYGLSDDEIAGMLTQGFASARQDMQERSLRESRVEAERLVLATRSALAGDGELLGVSERDVIETQLAALQETARGTDHPAIDTAVEALAKATEAFAARRMNRSIRSALAGRRVDDV
jgi:molecular chaperone HscA